MRFSRLSGHGAGALVLLGAGLLVVQWAWGDGRGRPAARTLLGSALQKTRAATGYHFGQTLERAPLGSVSIEGKVWNPDLTYRAFGPGWESYTKGGRTVIRDANGQWVFPEEFGEPEGAALAALPAPPDLWTELEGTLSTAKVLPLEGEDGIAVVETVGSSKVLRDRTEAMIRLGMGQWAEQLKRLSIDYRKSSLAYKTRIDLESGRVVALDAEIVLAFAPIPYGGAPPEVKQSVRTELFGFEEDLDPPVPEEALRKLAQVRGKSRR